MVIVKSLAKWFQGYDSVYADCYALNTIASSKGSNN